MMIVQTASVATASCVQIPAQELVPGDIVAVEAGDRDTGRRADHQGRHPGDRRVGPDRRERPGAEAGRPGAQRRHAAGRSGGHGLHEHQRHAWLGRAGGDGHRHDHRGRAYLGMLQATEDEKTPLTKQLDALTNQIIIIAGLALVASIALGYFIYDQPFETLFISAVAFAVAAVPTGLPAVVTTLLSLGHQDAGRGRRDREAPALGRDAGLDIRHQLGQDRHPDPEPDDGGRDDHPGPPLHHHGRGILDRPGRSRRSMASRRATSSPTCCRWRCAPMPRSATEGWSAIRPRARWSCWPPRAGSTRRRRVRRFPASPKLPFDAAYKLMATFHRMKDESGREVIRGFVKGAPDQLLARADNALDAGRAARHRRRRGRPVQRRERAPGQERACGSWRSRGATTTPPRSIRTPTCCRWCRT